LRQVTQLIAVVRNHPQAMQLLPFTAADAMVALTLKRQLISSLLSTSKEVAKGR
jgi:hypothetical protein